MIIVNVVISKPLRGFILIAPNKIYPHMSRHKATFHIQIRPPFKLADMAITEAITSSQVLVPTKQQKLVAHDCLHSLNDYR